MTVYTINAVTSSTEETAIKLFLANLSYKNPIKREQNKLYTIQKESEVILKSFTNQDR